MITSPQKVTSLKNRLAWYMFTRLNADNENSQLLDIISNCLSIYDKNIYKGFRPMFTIATFLIASELKCTVTDTARQIAEILRDHPDVSNCDTVGPYVNFSVAENIAQADIKRIFSHDQRTRATVFFPPVSLHLPLNDRWSIFASEAYARMLEELSYVVDRIMPANDIGEQLAESIIREQNQKITSPVLPHRLLRTVMKQISNEDFDVSMFIHNEASKIIHSLQNDLSFLGINNIHITSNYESTTAASEYTEYLVRGAGATVTFDSASGLVYDTVSHIILFDEDHKITNNGALVFQYITATDKGPVIIVSNTSQVFTCAKMAATRPYCKNEERIVSTQIERRCNLTYQNFNTTVMETLGIHNLPTHLLSQSTLNEQLINIDVNDLLLYEHSIERSIEKMSFQPLVNSINSTIARIESEANPSAKSAYAAFLARQLHIFSITSKKFVLENKTIDFTTNKDRTSNSPVVKGNEIRS